MKADGLMRPNPWIGAGNSKNPVAHLGYRNDVADEIVQHEILTAGFDDQNGMVNSGCCPNVRKAQGAGRKAGIYQGLALAQHVVFAVPRRRSKRPDVIPGVVARAYRAIDLAVDLPDLLQHFSAQFHLGLAAAAAMLWLLQAEELETQRGC